ncbi:hypothetical protein DFH29DRAFT_785482, partial [Suillus ampliporus]
PALDFEGTFFTFAIKEGISEFIHVHWNDDLSSITWLILLGNWEDGELVLLRKGLKQCIPMQPMDVFGFMACTLAYHITQITSG